MHVLAKPPGYAEPLIMAKANNTRPAMHLWRLLEGLKLTNDYLRWLLVVLHCSALSYSDLHLPLLPSVVFAPQPSRKPSFPST